MKSSKLLIFLLAAKMIPLMSAQPEFENFALPKFYDDDISYNVNLHLDSELFTTNGTQFLGKAEIRFAFNNITDYIALHSSYDMIELNKIIFDNAEVPTNAYSVNNVTDILTIYIGDLITIHVPYILIIEFSGTVTTNGLAGLYKSSYVNRNNETKYLLSTQLAPTYARSLFPCFDEPDYKAHFNFTVTFPSSLNVLFNTMEISRTHNTSLITVRFHQTPKMSTYILALVVSDLTCTFADDKIIPLRVCSRDELASRRLLALEIAPKFLANLDSFTNYNYQRHSIGKLDIVAVPEFPTFTMENWGLLIHRENDLLYDNVESSNQYKERVMKAIVHALAHQWFGNLVTFHWWTETFMNEGLATYFQYYIINQVFPYYEMDKRFVMDMLHEVLVEDARGLELFSLGLSGISTTAEIDFAFSEVSYQKGSSIIRMVQHFMSLECFREGIRNYINEHQYKNVDIEDLWTELDKTIKNSVSKMPANLSNVMHNWIWEAGYPLVTVGLNENTLTVSQSKFSYSRMENGTKWYIPISYTDSTHKLKYQSTTPDFWLTPDSDFSTNFQPETEWLILNNQQTGYYRVNYDPNLWTKIKAALDREHFDGIVEVNRAHIVDDLFNLARANVLTHSFVLDTIRFLKNDVSYYPWRAAVEDFDVILRRVGENTDLGKMIRTDILDLIDNFYNSVPISNTKENDHFYTLKQVLAVKWACRLGHQHCVKEVVKLFNIYKDSGKRPMLELRSIIYCNGLRYSNDDNDWYFMWDAYLKAKDHPSEPEIILKALGCSKNKILLKNYLQKTITKDSGIRPQDAVSAFDSVRVNPDGLDIAFDFLIENQEAIVEHYQASNGMMHQYGPVEFIFLGTAIRLTSEEQITKLKELINNGSLKEGFVEHIRKVKFVTNITKNWRQKYSEDLKTYYNNNVHTSYYLYLLLLLIPVFMLMACKYHRNERRNRILIWIRNLNPMNIRNRRREDEQLTDGMPMLEQ